MSACLVAGCAIAMVAGWAMSSERRITSYAVHGALDSISLDLGSAAADVVGGGERPEVEVRRTEDFAFGQQAVARRTVTDRELRIRSRCPRAVLGSCSVRYRVTVPDNVPVTVRTTSGDVRFSGFRGSARIDTGTGNIDVGTFCGFSLRARADSGDVDAGASCPPERLELRSRTGDVRATVPPGRYRLDADSDGGRRRVGADLMAVDDAPFQIQALSGEGDVDVQTGP